MPDRAVCGWYDALFLHSHGQRVLNGRAAATLSGEKGVNQSATTRGWNVRQSTCGTLSGDVCESSADTGISHAFRSDGSGLVSSYPFVPGTNTISDGKWSTCSLNTEALMIMPIEQFFTVLQDDCGNDYKRSTTGAQCAGATHGVALQSSTQSSVLVYTW